MTFNVVDPDGNPVADASILSFFSPATFLSDPASVRLEVGLGFDVLLYQWGSALYTGADGSVTVSTHATLSVHATVLADGYLYTYGGVAYPVGVDGTVTVTLTPPEFYSLTGRVLEADGSVPVDGTATIDGQSVEVDPVTGVFAVAQVRSFRTHDLALSFPDGSGGTSTFTDDVDMDANVDLGTLTLPPRHTLTVNVVDQSNSPVAGADIQLVNNAQHGVQLSADRNFIHVTDHTGVTDAAGTHTITTHTNPTVELTAESAGQGITLTVNHSTDRTITVADPRRPGAVPGRGARRHQRRGVVGATVRCH